MKYVFFVLVLCATMWSCTSRTQLTTSLKTAEYEPMEFKRLGVGVLVPSISNRAIVETAVSDAITANGTHSIPTFTIFPLAGRSDIIENMNLTPEQLRNIIREKIQKFEIDALLIISLLDTQTEEHYVAPTGITATSSYFAGQSDLYGFGYADYYQYTYTKINKPGYYEQRSTYFLESNLYDISTEKLIWTGQTTTKDPSSIEEEAVNYARILVDEMLSKGVLKK